MSKFLSFSVTKNKHEMANTKSLKMLVSSAVSVPGMMLSSSDQAPG